MLWMEMASAAMTKAAPQQQAATKPLSGGPTRSTHLPPKAAERPRKTMAIWNSEAI